MISVIIPAHNEKKNLKSLLSKLSNIGDDQTEVIIALSSSNSDCSEELHISENTIFYRCNRMGRALQMNQAASTAKGDVLAFLHADVMPPESFLSDIKRTIEKDFDAGFFSYRFDKESFFLKINASFTAKDGIFSGGGDQCLFIRKSVFEKLGGFDENQVVMEDFEFFERMKKNKVRYKIVKNDLIVSARKYEHNSYLRVNLSNLFLVTLFKFGYPANKLKALHSKLIRTPYQNHS